MVTTGKTGWPKCQIVNWSHCSRQGSSGSLALAGLVYGIKGCAALLAAMVLVSILSTPALGMEEPPKNDESTRVVIVEDPDDPSVWAIVDAFQAEPTRDNTTAVLQFLKEKLDDWNSHPAGLITTILETIGEKKIREGEVYATLLLHVDPALPSAMFVKSTAARTLGALGGAKALQELVQSAKSAPLGVLPSVAVALGMLGAPQVLPTLEKLADHPDIDTRARAISALAKYCSSTSREIVLRRLTDVAAGVRKSAEWWLAACPQKTSSP